MIGWQHHLIVAASTIILTMSTTFAGVVPSDTFGATFGNGLAGIKICSGSAGPPSVVVNRTLTSTETHGVLHHFWCTKCGFVDSMWVEYFVDGETTPSISFQPPMMCGVAFPKRYPKTDRRYSAGGLCGKSAEIGGWWNTFPIPFYKSIQVTVRGDPAFGDRCTTGWVNVRGTVGMPLVLPGSGMPLPNPGTRLMLQKNPLALHQPLEYVTVASLPAGQRGMVFQTTWAVEANPVGGVWSGGGYIEGCWQFYGTHSEPFPGLIVGTGVEDYFDSGFYFGADSGEAHMVNKTLFATPLSGLTLFDRTGDTESLSAYRFHNADPLVMTDGGRLVWRVGAKGEAGTTKCGNPLPETESIEELAAESGRTLSAVNVTTYAWVYTFPDKRQVVV